MTAPATPMIIPERAQRGFVQLKNSCIDAFATYEDIRFQMQQIDIAYMRENDQTVENAKARLRNRMGDTTKFQNIVVPIIAPAVETATEYQTEVFLQGYPIFSFVGAPKDWAAVEQMNVIIEDQSCRGGWTQQLLMSLRDGFKYNIGSVDFDWAQVAMPVLETDISISTKEGQPKEIIWAGNILKHVDLYNAFWDTRYFPSEVSKRGEFAGYHTLLSRTEMKAWINSCDCKLLGNVIPALESNNPGYGMATNGVESVYTYNIPQLRTDISANLIPQGEPDWNQWVDEALGVTGGHNGTSKQIRYRNTYILTTLYVRIIPADFNLKVSASQTPQIWKMYFVNNDVLIGAKRLTNAHNNLPMMLFQPNEDGLGYQTKSLAKNQQDIQDVSSAMLNSVIAARRRAISDRTLYDPSRVSEQHINSANPSAKIPMRPAGYGKPVSESVYAFPFRDENSGTILSELPMIMGLGDLNSGQNKTRRGQFQKGNKTLKEFETVNDNSNGRDMMCAIGLEASFFTPLKEMAKINILQYQGTGVIFSQQLQKEVNIDPVVLRNTAMSFKVSDGLTPTAKLLNGDALQQGLQTIAAVPQIASGYNITPLFSYLMKTQNADLSPFEKSMAQITYEQAAQSWQQAVMVIAEKGGDPNKLGPQPKPADFGYDPNLPPGTPPTNPAASPSLQAAPPKVTVSQKGI